MAPDTLTHLSSYHPVVIEGMGGYDNRDPDAVAATLATRLQSHWLRRPVDKPRLLVIQGDPPEARGISAITPRVAGWFGLSRALVCLDEDRAEYHARDADREKVILEYRYSQFCEILGERHPEALPSLERAVDAQIETKNARRQAVGKPPLKPYFRDFALLQEVTKAACRSLCGELTVAHTAAEIHEFSVTSFYTVGLALGLVKAEELVRFG